MNSMLSNVFYAMVLGLAIGSLSACGGSSTGGTGDAGNASGDATQVNGEGVTQVDAALLQQNLADVPLASLSADERDGLLFTREEEKLALDVYTTLYDVYGLAIFTNIAAAEQTHTDSVKVLLDRYDLTDPVVQPSVVGVFTNPVLQQLYDDLVNEASDLISALQVGARIEELDIRDIEAELTKVDNDDIRIVYENLLKGSRNHLRSFYKTLQQKGGDYTPVFITQEAFDAIVNSDMER